MEEFLTIEALVIVLVLVATLVAIAVRRIRLPYTVSLVLVGLFISIRRPIAIEVTPELILSIFVPPLIFEAALHLDYRLLRSNLASIIMLALPGVILTTLLVGGMVALGAGLSFASAAVFGALIAATDPVAVVALFRALGVPRQLAAAVEGESLFNFFKVAFGGMGIGLALGWLAAQLMARVDDRLIVSTLTTLLAYGSYLVAEHFHVSGVLAVVMAGLMSGNVGLAGASPTTKIMLFNLWDYLGFLANSLVFLLIGLDVDLAQLWANLIPIAIAVTAVLLSRALVVYGMPLIARVFRRKPLLPLSWRHILFWGGLRGAISLALVLSVPVALAERAMLESMTFGVMLFTLLVQGTTIQFLLDRLGLTQQPPHRIAREKRLGQFFAAQAGMRRLEDLRREGLLLDEMWNGLRADYLRAQKRVTDRMIQLFHDHAELEREMLLQARREALQAERGALGDALRRGFLSEHVYTELVTDIDYRLEALNLIQTAIVGEAH